MEKKALLDVSGLYKKFTKGLRGSMRHGIEDLLRGSIGRPLDGKQLRDGEIFALNNIDLQLNEHEILGVTGMNGSGKTTLMRLIAGIYMPDAGTITALPGLKVTAIFALGAGMQPLFTGRENIYIKGAMYGMSRAEIEAEIPFIESFSELDERLDRPFGNYSSGMKARLSYSIAMATRPDVFIIDESLAVGDSAFKAKCMDNLREFADGAGKGVIFVSNQIRKTLKIADRLLVMERGAIIHETEDIAAGLEFYIENCYAHLGEERQRAKMAKVKNYEL